MPMAYTIILLRLEVVLIYTKIYHSELILQDQIMEILEGLQEWWCICLPTLIYKFSNRKLLPSRGDMSGYETTRATLWAISESADGSLS